MYAHQQLRCAVRRRKLDGSCNQGPLLMSEELGLVLHIMMVLRSVNISDGHDDLRRGLHNLYLARTGTTPFQRALDNSVEDRAFVISSPTQAKNPVGIQIALLAIGVLTNEMNTCLLVELLQLITNETMISSLLESERSHRICSLNSRLSPKILFFVWFHISLSLVIY